MGKDYKAQLAIIGGGTGGFAAAWAALRCGLKVIVTEEYDRLGGQFTSQAVPPDEHPWIEDKGATRSYRQFRQYVRQYYHAWYPLKDENWQRLNPGLGCVSALCHEPLVSSAIIEAILRPYVSSGQLQIFLHSIPIEAHTVDDKIKEVILKNSQGETFIVKAEYFIDATECGDLLPLAKADYSIGSEAKAETGEPHAKEEADPQNQQAISWCFVIDYDPYSDHTLPKPEQYDFWHSYVPDLQPSWGSPLLSWQATHPITLEPVVRSFNPLHPQPERGPMDLWTFRRISCAQQFNYPPGTSDIVLVNWPQIDYMLGNIIDVTPQEKAKHLEGARQLSLSMFSWMQEQGWPGLRLRPDITGTKDGLAAAPYIRESRRIKGLFTVLEQHVGLEARQAITGLSKQEVRAAKFRDSVGIGAYRLDLHPTTKGDNYVDVSSLPFQIPLGALIPQKFTNLLAGGKNLSVTHITNGCYRLHPIEWNVGEVAALCVAFCLDNRKVPSQVWHEDETLLSFQNALIEEGIELEWQGQIYSR